MNKFKIAALVSGLIIQSVAHAGYTTKDKVIVTTTGAYGNISAARHSSDSKEYIGCFNQNFIGSTELTECVAVDKDGNVGYCYLYNASPAVIASVAGINESSYILFIHLAATYACTAIQVSNSSEFVN